NGRKEISHGGGIEGFNTYLGYWPEEKLSVIVLGNLNGQAPGEIAAKLAAAMHGEQVTLPSERKETSVLPQVLQAYVGTYELEPGVDMTITLDGGQLMIQLKGQPKFPLFAQSKTLFFLKVVDAQVEFLKDSSGKVTRATLHQNGHDVVAHRSKGAA
ncbi:MAG: DUF3471 domain-containing protein, partial [Bryobacteraceae bacterium]